MLKVIDKNTDEIIKKPYYLCRANFGELVKFVKGKFKDTDFTKFNEAFTGNERISKDEESIYSADFQKEYKEYLEYNSYSSEPKENFEIWKAEHIERKKEYRKEKIQGITNEEQLHNFIFDAATENNFISLYSEDVKVDGSQIGLSGTFYLLDGFRRLLFDFDFVEKNYDKEVYVKVYDNQTTDSNMMGIMFHFNLWKFPQGIGVWLDRGWRFFLFKRLNITLEKAHFHYLDNYLDKGRWGQTDYRLMYKLLTSQKFYDDFTLIDEFIKKKAILRVETGGNSYNTKDGEFISLFLKYLGKARLKGNFKDILLEDFIKFLDVNVNEVYRIQRMCVRGHYEKVVNKLIASFFEIWFDKVKLQKLRDKDLATVVVKEIPIMDYINSFSKEIIEEFKLEGRYEITISVKKRSFIYKASKIYLEEGGVQDPSKLRVYLFFGDCVVYKKGKFFFIHDLSKGEVSWHSEQNKESVLFKGDKTDLLKHLKLLGVGQDLNSKKTEFIGGLK